MGCTVAQRTRAREAIEALAACRSVAATDLLTPDVALSGRWTVEVTLTDPAAAPVVAEILAEHGLWTREVRPLGPDHGRLLAEVR